MTISLTLFGQIAVASIVLLVPLMAWMAHNRGLSPVAWGGFGLVFPFSYLGLIALLFVKVQKRVPSEPIGESS